MAYTVEKISGNQVKITFEIAADKFDAAMQKAYLKVRGQVNVQGFRKGKAPRKMIENLYGEAVFYDDAFDAIFPEAYEEAVRGENIQVVDRPEVDTVDQ
ncbi:MAG: trigger factor family protein, partial [Clostridia bacterium]|nr:trigger factor family protein [Clostridia bacterium]